MFGQEPYLKSVFPEPPWLPTQGRQTLDKLFLGLSWHQKDRKESKREVESVDIFWHVPTLKKENTY